MTTKKKKVMERESFIFYTSWIEGLEDYTEKEQGEIILALIKYCAYGIEPKDAKRHVKMAFRYAKPQIDTNNRKYVAGQKGGSRNGVSNNPLGRRGKTKGTTKKLPKNYQETTNGSFEKLPKNYQETTNGSFEKLPKNYQETTKELPNDNVNVNENVNVNDNDSVVIDFPDGKSIERKEISLPDGNAKKSKAFVKPTVDEVAEFLATKGLTREDAEQFWLFYESKNWFVGKNKMQIWRASAAGWAHRELEERKMYGKNNRYGNKTGNTRAAGPLWTPTEDEREHPERHYKTTFQGAADDGGDD